MVRIALYILLVSAVYSVALAAILTGFLSPQFAVLQNGLACGLFGGIGGCIYCLRAIYLNTCVHKQWDEVWHIWYYLRPLVSVFSGGASYLFLRAGLLILESDKSTVSSNLGFYAFALIAGLNVDRFMNKIEDVAKTVWGIEKSRTANQEDGKKS